MGGEDAGHGGHGGDGLGTGGDLALGDALEFLADHDPGVAVLVVGKEVAADGGAVLEGEGADAIAFGDLGLGVEEGAEEIGGVLRFADGGEFGSDVASDAVHGVAALALGGAVAEEDGHAALDVATGLAEALPLGEGIILREAGAEGGEGGLHLGGVGGLGGEDDVEGDLGLHLVGDEFVEVGLDDFGGFGAGEFAEGLEGELFFGDTGLLVVEGLGEEGEGLGVGVEAQEDFAGLGADLVALVGGESFEGFLPLVGGLLPVGEEIEGEEAGLFGSLLVGEVAGEVFLGDGELFLFHQLQGPGEEFGGALVGGGGFEVRLQHLGGGGGEGAAVCGKRMDEGGDGIGSGGDVPVEEGEEGVTADAEVADGIVDDFGHHHEVLGPAEGPGGIDGAAGGEGMVFDLGSDPLGDGEGPGGEVRVGAEDVFIVGAANGFLADGGVLVIEEGGDLGGFLAAEGDDGGAADGGGSVGAEGGELGGLGAVGEDHDAAVADDDILVVVDVEHGDGVIGGALMAFVGEGEGGEGDDAEGGIVKEGEEGFAIGGELFRVGAEGAGGVGADLDLGVLEEGGEGLEGSGIACGELAEAPQAVEAAEEGLVGGDGLFEEGARFVAAFGEGELGALADALVGVGEEVEEFVRGEGGDAFGEELFDLVDEGVGEARGIVEGVDVAVVGAFPAAAVVGDVHLAVVAPVEVGHGDAFEEGGGFLEGEAGAVGFEGEIFDEAAIGSGDVADHEEVFCEALREGGAAGVVGQSAGAVDGVGDGGENVGGLAVVAWQPKAFVHPGVELVLLAGGLGADVVEGVVAEGDEGLVAFAPAGIAVFDDVNDAFAVAVVIVVVDGEEVAEFVEDDLLGVAEVEGEDLEVGAVGVGAEDGAAVGAGEGLAVLFNVVAAVADGPVEFAVGAEGEAVHVVTGKADADAEAGDEGLDLLGLSVAVVVAEAVDAGDVGEVDGAVLLDESAGGAGEGFVEVVPEGDAPVGLAIAGGVFEEDDRLGLIVELVPGEVVLVEAGPFFVEGLAVFEGHGGDVAEDAVAEELVVGAAVADVLHLDAPAVGFGGEDAALAIDAEGGGVGDLGVVGEPVESEFGGDGDLGEVLGGDVLGGEGKGEAEEEQEAEAGHGVLCGTVRC